MSQLGNAWGQPLPAGHADTKRVLDEVLAERLRQEQLLAKGKFAWTCADPQVSDADKLAVLGEEFGEAAREVNEATNERAWIAAGKRDGYELPIHRRNRRAELIQVAAVAVAWAEALKP